MTNRWWLLLALVVAVGCPGNRKRTVGGTGGGTGGTTGADNGGGETVGEDAAPTGPVLRKVMHLTVELQVVDPDADPIQTAVDLVMTDETGANDRTDVGEFTGACTDTSAQHKTDPMNPILSVDCPGGQPGIALRFVHRGSQLIVLRAKIFEGEELSFDEHQRIALPEAVPIKTDYE